MQDNELPAEFFEWARRAINDLRDRQEDLDKEFGEIATVSTSTLFRSANFKGYQIKIEIVPDTGEE